MLVAEVRVIGVVPAWAAGCAVLLNVEVSPLSGRMRAAVLTRMPGLEVRTWVRGWAASILSTLPASCLRWWSTVFRVSASRGSTVSAAAVPGMMTVCSSSAVMMASTSMGAEARCVRGGAGGELFPSGVGDAGWAAAARQDLEHSGVSDRRAEGACEGRGGCR